MCYNLSMDETQEKEPLQQKKGVKDLTLGKPHIAIISFALPIFLSQLFQQLYSTADAFIVGQFLGTQSLGAVSSSGNLIFLLVSFFNGTAMGAGVVIARYFGAKNEENVKKAIHTNLAFGLVCGVLLTIVGVIFTPTFLRWMNTDENLMSEAVEYFRFYFLGSLSTVLYNICRSIMNAVGNSKRPLYYLIFSSVLNVLLDLVFIGVFRWGVWSAAIATVISQTASVVMCFNYLLKKGNIFSVELKQIKFDGKMLKEIIRIGLPSGVQNSVIALANVIVQSQINSFGEYATTAYGVYSKIEGFAFMPIMSFSLALTTFIGQNLGAKQYDRAKKGARFGIITGVITAEIIAVALYFAAPYLIQLFDSEKTPEVIELGVRQIHTTSLFYFLLAYSHCIAGICRGAGRAIVPMIIMLSVWCVLRVIYIYIIMQLTTDIIYIYWAYPLTWAISSIIYFIYYVSADWVHAFEKQKERKLKPQK